MNSKKPRQFSLAIIFLVIGLISVIAAWYVDRTRIQNELQELELVYEKKAIGRRVAIQSSERVHFASAFSQNENIFYYRSVLETDLVTTITELFQKKSLVDDANEGYEAFNPENLAGKVIFLLGWENNSAKEFLENFREYFIKNEIQLPEFCTPGNASEEFLRFLKNAFQYRDRFEMDLEKKWAGKMTDVPLSKGILRPELRLHDWTANKNKVPGAD